MLIGVKQGGHISSVLFVTAIEPFFYNLQKKLLLAGNGTWAKILKTPLSSYADDTNILLSSHNQLDIVNSEYSNFSNFSASKLNENKSEILLLGKRLI